MDRPKLTALLNGIAMLIPGVEDPIARRIFEMLHACIVDATFPESNAPEIQRINCRPHEKKDRLGG
jgi:hypothetical protein